MPEGVNQNSSCDADAVHAWWGLGTPTARLPRLCYMLTLFSWRPTKWQGLVRAFLALLLPPREPSLFAKQNCSQGFLTSRRWMVSSVAGVPLSCGASSIRSAVELSTGCALAGAAVIVGADTLGLAWLSPMIAPGCLIAPLDHWLGVLLLCMLYSVVFLPPLATALVPALFVKCLWLVDSGALCIQSAQRTGWQGEPWTGSPKKLAVHALLHALVAQLAAQDDAQGLHVE